MFVSALMNVINIVGHAIGIFVFKAGVAEVKNQSLPSKKAMIVISNGKSTKIKMAQVMGMQEDNAQDFITMLEKLQKVQKDCGVDHLKMSDYGFTEDEFQTLVENARATMGGLFASDPVDLSNEDCVKIFELSFR